MSNPLPSTFHEPAQAGAKSPGDGSPWRDRVKSLRLSEEVTARHSTRPWLPWSLALLFAATSAVLGYAMMTGLGPKPSASEQTEKIDNPAATSRAASTAAHVPGDPGVAPASGSVALRVKGYIIPARTILVSPKVPGMVVEMRKEKRPIEEGDFFNAGEIIAELEKTDYLADVDRAKAALALATHRRAELDNPFRPEEKEQAQAELDEAERDLRMRETDFARSTKLWEQKVLTDEEYQTAEASYRMSEQRVRRLKAIVDLAFKPARAERIAASDAEVAQATADLKKAQWRLENTTIRAPISGTILRKAAEEGNVVNPIAMNGSFSLCEIADLADLEVDLSVQEIDIAKVRVDQECRIEAEAYPGRSYQGWVSRLMPIADRAKGAVPVRVKIIVPAEERGAYLKPEMGAVVDFLNNKYTGPRAATVSAVAAPRARP